MSPTPSWPNAAQEANGHARQTASPDSGDASCDAPRKAPSSSFGDALHKAPLTSSGDTPCQATGGPDHGDASCNAPSSSSGDASRKAPNPDHSDASRRELAYERATRRANALKVAAVVVDLLLVNASYLAAFYLRFLGDPPERNFTTFVQAWPFLTLSALAYIDMCGMLKFYRRSRRAALSAILKFVGLQGLTAISVTYVLIGDLAFPRTILVGIAPALQAAFLTAWHWLVLGARAALHDTPRAVLIGGEEATRDFIERLSRASLAERRAVDVRHSYGFSDISKIMRALRHVDEVILCSDVPWALKTEILLAASGMKKVVCFVPGLLDISMASASLIHVGDMPLYIAERLSLTSEQRFFKRVFDIAATCVALPLALPIMAAAAAAVKATSPGPALYGQDRVTADGRVYRIYKFRTMNVGAEAETGPVLSAEGDERVTRVGRFLRRYRIDELPQLFNVLRGSLSLVGPRPERPFFVERFSKDIEGYRLRTNVKAGLTGYAQIYGDYGTSPEMKLRHDILYIRKYSLLLDVKLLLLTALAVMKKGGGSSARANAHAPQS